MNRIKSSDISRKKNWHKIIIKNDFFMWGYLGLFGAIWDIFLS